MPDLLKINGSFMRPGNFLTRSQADCCCPDCPPNCGCPTVLAVRNAIFWEGPIPLVGPFDTEITWFAPFYAVNTVLASCTFGLKVAIVLTCDMTLDPDTGLIVPCTSKYQLFAEIDCCNATPPTFSTGVFSETGFTPVKESSSSPLTFHIDLPTGPANGNTFCILPDDETEHVITSFTCTIEDLGLGSREFCP